MPNDNNRLGQTDTDAIIGELNQLFTPILVANEMAATSVKSIENSTRSVIRFDADTHKAQLISVCARLIAKFRNTGDYREYINAATRAKALKLKMQKENHGASVALADEYLHRLIVSADNSDVVRAATTLSNVKVTLG